MQIPIFIQNIMHRLSEHGYQVYLVGGCVRDMLLGRVIHDYDLTTNAKPDAIQSLFEDHPLVLTGLKHGTVGIVCQKQVIEITSHRKEGIYENHRHPDQVYFENVSLSEDLCRRDFTINAMALDIDGNLYDEHHGRIDLDNHLIRCVGNPERRFQEDSLRILRCVRFSMQLGFSIEPNTLQALKKQASLLNNIAKERIRDEFHLMLESNAQNILARLQEWGLLEILFPELNVMIGYDQQNPWHPYDLFTHTNIALNHTVNASLNVKLAVCFHDIGKPYVQTFDNTGIAHYHNHANKSVELVSDILKRYHYSSKQSKSIKTIIAFHDYYLKEDETFLRKFLGKIDFNYDLAYEILKVQYADDHAKNKEAALPKIQTIEHCISLLQQMEKDGICIQMKDLCINGYDLLAQGYQKKDIGKLKQKLLQHIIANPQENTKVKLLAYLKQTVK